MKNEEKMTDDRTRKENTGSKVLLTSRSVWNIYKAVVNFIETRSQSAEHIEDMDKNFDEYLSTFIKYPH